MKWLFLTFLSLNIGIFIWGLNRDAEKESANISHQPAVNHGNLQLLSEIQSKTPSKNSYKTSDLSESDFNLVTMEVKEPLVPAYTASTSRIPVQIPLDQIPYISDSTPIQPAIHEITKATTSPKPIKSRPGINLKDKVEKSVYLPPVNKSWQNNINDVIATNSKIGNPASPPPTKPYACTIVSPIRNETTGYRLLDRFSRAGIPAWLTKTPKTSPSYWVLIPPQPNLQKAEAFMNTLSSHGYNDIWLVDKGELENAVSLGLFSNIGNAQSYMTEIARLGMPVELKKQKPGSTAQYSIHFPTKFQLDVTSTDWAQITKDHQELKLRKTQCEAIASP